MTALRPPGSRAGGRPGRPAASTTQRFLAVVIVLDIVAAVVAVGWLGRPDPPMTDQIRAGRVADVEGDVRDLVQAVLDRAPLRGSNGYRRPTPEDLTVIRAAFRQVMEGSLSKAAESAAGIGYGILRFRDRWTGRRLVALVERPAGDGSMPRGWGVYVVDPGGSAVLVQVPHPLADIDTERLGLEVFRNARPRALLVAGAHRGAAPDGGADVAHEEASPFHAGHTVLLRRGDVVLQVHGFDARHRLGVEVVVSSGAPSPGAVARTVARHLRGSGIDVCVYDGTACSELAGTTNVQGRATLAAGQEFLHVEVARGLRRHPAARRRLAGVLVAGLRPEAAPPISDSSEVGGVSMSTPCTKGVVPVAASRLRRTRGSTLVSPGGSA